jgi:hypothetical protein
LGQSSAWSRPCSRGDVVRHGELVRASPSTKEVALMMKHIMDEPTSSPSAGSSPRRRKPPPGARPLVVLAHPPVLTKPRKGPFHHPPARQSHVPSRWHEPLPVDLSPRLGSPGARAARGSRSSGHRRWHRESRGGVAPPWSVGRRNVRLDALPLGVGEIGQIAPFHAQERTSSTHPFAFPNGSSTHSAE